MEWSIRKGVDGVITDDPGKFLEVCERWKGGGGERGRTVGQGVREVFVRLVMFVLAPLVWLSVRQANRKGRVPMKV